MHLIFGRSNLLRCLLVFLIGIPSGLGFSIVLPQIARYYFAFVAHRVASTMGTPAGVPLGVSHVLIIVANNLIPVIVGFSLPALIASYNLYYSTHHPERYSSTAPRLGAVESKRPASRLGSEIYNNLSAFAFVVAFVFGFLVFGAFFGYFLISGGLPLLEKVLNVIAPHAPFEIAATLMSASVALGLRDSLLQQIDSGVGSSDLSKHIRQLLRSKRMAISLALVVLLVCLGAIVEVYVSAPLARAG